MSFFPRQLSFIFACSWVLITLQAIQAEPPSAIDSKTESSDANVVALASLDQFSNPEPKTENNLKLLYSYLDDSRAIIQEKPHHKAFLEKHVSVDGKLQDKEKIDVKIRHTPFSAYMKWRGDGQEVLYVSGENENRLIARPTNGLALLRRIWRLEPDSKQAMMGCRYPITELGLANLSERLHKFYSSRDSREGLTCSMRETELNGRPTVIFDVTFHSPEECSEYSHSTIYFDALGKWIIGVENKGWTADGREGDLVEKYVYHDIDFDARLKDDDFSTDNPKYDFSE